MSQPLVEENQFIVDLLTTLQRDHFRARAWWNFLVISWHKSCEIARNAPSLKRSWIRVTIFISVLIFVVLLGVSIFEDPVVALRLLPGFIFCIAWQQSDMFWHLGLIKRPQSDELLPSIGLANTFTALRGLGASFLLGRIVGGIHTSADLAMTVFLFGVLTDILDGKAARWTHTQSRFGQIADGEADFCLYLALSIILVQDGILPLWLGIVFILRFFVPLIAAFVSYFLFAQPVRFGSTNWGKYAGLAQCLYFFVLLAPWQLATIVQFVKPPLLIITLILMLIAPITQIRLNLKGKRA